MAGKRSSPRLVESTNKSNTYYCAYVYMGDNRKKVSFGPKPKSAIEQLAVQAKFESWLELFNDNPSRTLSFKSPDEALGQLRILRGSVKSLGDLVKVYRGEAEQTFKFTETGRINAAYDCWEMGVRMMSDYSSWQIDKFGAEEFRQVQENLKTYRYTRGKKDQPKPLTRSRINRSINELKRMFDWAVGEEFMQITVEHRLRKAVKTLRMGAKSTFDPDKRDKVSDDDFARVWKIANPTLRGLITTMRFSVCRPDEVCNMRPMDFHMDDPECWLYVPRSEETPVGRSKTTGSGNGNGKVHVIPIIESLQKVLQPFIDQCESKESFLFKPCVSNGRGRTGQSMIKPGERYRVNSVYEALQRTCKRAGVDRFSLYDLRRASVTDISSLMGRDQAYRMVGHSSPVVTDVYNMAINLELIAAAKRYAQETAGDDLTTF